MLRKESKIIRPKVVVNKCFLLHNNNNIHLLANFYRSKILTVKPVGSE